ncbi:3-deoxy-manno-octulosonate cytidylyltransferase [candidate division KSB1 bacterium]|nr:3-deoxy-manno-octulosonate cytidylyltransferase [candidate division KSB1 bacterium]
MSDKNQRVIGVIPARYGSSRFPGKIIADIAGKPMIQRVYERTLKSKLLDELYVAVDDERVQKCVRGFGGNAVMTDPQHQSGTDRIAEAVGKVPADIVVNVQGDQPLLDPLMIDEAVQPLLDHPELSMSTLKVKIEKEEDWTNPNIVKVVTDENQIALYFSRSLIPFPRDDRQRIEVFEHIGLYVYRKDFLLKYSSWPTGRLEQIEKLEQLRVLEKSYKIMVIETKSNYSEMAGYSVDTPEDLARVIKYIEDTPGWE